MPLLKSHFGHVNGINHFKWIEHVRQLLTLDGFSGIWDTHVFPNGLWLAKKAVKQKLIDTFLNEWQLELHTKASAYIYRIFK